MDPSKKITDSKFFKDEEKIQNFSMTNFEHFDIFRNEKYILVYNLNFKKCHVSLNLSKPGYDLKNNTF